jgi:hypothetical protein
MLSSMRYGPHQKESGCAKGQDQALDQQMPYGVQSHVAGPFQSRARFRTGRRAIADHLIACLVTDSVQGAWPTSSSGSSLAALYKKGPRTAELTTAPGALRGGCRRASVWGLKRG